MNINIINMFCKESTTDSLNSYFELFYSSTLAGYLEFVDNNGEQLLDYRPTTRANVIYDLVISKLKLGLINDPKVKFLNTNQLLTIIIEDKYILKFKKLNQKRKSSNIPTKQTSLFSTQQNLFDFKNESINLELGYILNKYSTEIEGIYLVCPRNTKSNYWEIDIEDHLLQNKTDLFNIDPNGPKKPVTRFSVKQEENNDQKTETA